MTNTQSPTKCLTCQYDAKREAGITLTETERNYWSLWGCTCDEADRAEAVKAAQRLVR